MMVGTKSKSTLKTMVIGLDGATFDVILPFIKEKRLPTLARLLEEGAWGELQSTIPPITAAAWTSFMTGENPGKHGIIGFTKTGTGEYSEEQVVTTKDFAGKTFFDIMSDAGMRVGVITVPVTYPPWDINGIMISGYPSPDNAKIYSVTRDIVLNIEEPLNFSADYYQVSTEEQIVEDCVYRDRLRSDLTFDLLGQHEFDCFVVVLGGTDRAQHDYWKYYDPNYPGVRSEDRKRFQDAIYRNYELADEQIAKFLNIYGEGTNLVIISDHGAGRHPFKFFNVNLWLKRNGWLQIENTKALPREVLRKMYYGLQRFLVSKNKKSTPLLPKVKPRRSMTGGGTGRVMNWQKTQAFYYPLGYPTGGIMINLEARQPMGVVKSGEEYDYLVNGIIQRLLEYRDETTGEKVVEQAFRREEIYDGPYAHSFPDVIYVLNPGYESGKEIFGSIISSVPQFRLSKISGLHLTNGIFIARGPDIRSCQVKGARLIDIAPTLLYGSGLPIPRSMDGEVLESIFKENILKERPATYSTWKGKTIEKDFAVGSPENEEMKEKLRSLGYI